MITMSIIFAALVIYVNYDFFKDYDKNYCFEENYSSYVSESAIKAMLFSILNLSLITVLVILTFIYLP